MKFKHSSKCSCLVAIVFIALISGCASKHKLQGTLGGPPGAHKVTQIMYLVSKEEIRNLSHISDRLASAGVDLASIRDGSIVAGRIYCCGGEGTPEIVNNVLVYIPQNWNVKQGDILEFVEGQGPEGKGKSQLNVAVKVRHENGIESGTCKWVPEDPYLWLRVLYCSWMDNEGWVEGGFLTPEWYKIPGN